MAVVTISKVALRKGNSVTICDNETTTVPRAGEFKRSLNEGSLLFHRARRTFIRNIILISARTVHRRARVRVYEILYGHVTDGSGSQPVRDPSSFRRSLARPFVPRRRSRRGFSSLARAFFFSDRTNRLPTPVDPGPPDERRQKSPRFRPPREIRSLSSNAAPP